MYGPPEGSYTLTSTVFSLKALLLAEEVADLPATPGVVGKSSSKKPFFAPAGAMAPVAEGEVLEGLIGE